MCPYVTYNAHVTYNAKKLTYLIVSVLKNSSDVVIMSTK